MPRPKTDPKEADTVGFWMPDATEVGAKIEGHLTDATKEDGFRGNIYHLVDDEGVKTRLPVHAELQRKLDGVRLDMAAGKVEDWVVIEFTGRTEDEHRHYKITYFPTAAFGKDTRPK